MAPVIDTDTPIEAVVLRSMTVLPSPPELQGAVFAVLCRQLP
jgi:hypothetical protein